MGCDCSISVLQTSGAVGCDSAYQFSISPPPVIIYTVSAPIKQTEFCGTQVTANYSPNECPALLVTRQLMKENKEYDK